jgi:hypothetical protein
MNKAEAGIYVRKSCQKTPGEECGDSCEAEHVNELPPLWLDDLPPCECWGQLMHLLRPLIAIPTWEKRKA